MFATGTITYAPQHRNCVANYPSDDIDELSILFPHQSCNEIQTRLNNDMLKLVKLTNQLRVGDVLDVDVFGVNYHFIDPSYPNLESNRVQVVDIVCGITVFDQPISHGVHAGNIDQSLSLKDYASQDLAHVYKNDRDFTLHTHVRSTLKVYFECVHTGVRYWFNLRDTTPFKLVRRARVGDTINVDGEMHVLKSINPNYLMVKDKSHWEYISDNIGTLRDNVSNSYRCSWTLDNDVVVSLHEKDEDKTTPIVVCPCVDKESTKRKICKCTKDKEDTSNDELVSQFATSLGSFAD